ncbi:MAG: flavodoxin family protein [Armatimonadetes bacterium]|nr:flavodoxin family protein [Candidatus Hippobium faecium]
MKAVLLNGSPRKEGNTYSALMEMKKIFDTENIEAEIIQVGSRMLTGCHACGGCGKTGKCVIDDGANEIIEKMREADAVVLGSPVYYAGVNGTFKGFLDRAFIIAGKDMRLKVGASVVAMRRGGGSATFDELNKYFFITEMIVAGSSYWNSVHGTAPGTAQKDEEGMQTMRKLARNISYILKLKENSSVSIPENEPKVSTNL